MTLGNVETDIKIEKIAHPSGSAKEPQLAAQAGKLRAEAQMIAGQQDKWIADNIGLRRPAWKWMQEPKPSFTPVNAREFRYVRVGLLSLCMIIGAFSGVAWAMRRDQHGLPREE